MNGATKAMNTNWHILEGVRARKRVFKAGGREDSGSKGEGAEDRKG